MKIALFRYSFGAELDSGFETVETEGKEDYTGYTRLSEYKEVEFTLLPRNSVIANRVKSLDKSIAETTREFSEKLDKLQRVRAELLALQFDGPGKEDGEWSPGWKERTQSSAVDTDDDLPF